MARVKVKLADNIARVVFLDPEATKGATLGTNLYLPDGSLATAASLSAYLGVSTTVASQGSHRALQGLALGDDHPQYTQWAQNETVSGAWNFTGALTHVGVTMIETASNLGYGAQVFDSKSVHNLAFRSLLDGNGVNVTEGADDITFSLATTDGSAAAKLGDIWVFDGAEWVLAAGAFAGATGRTFYFCNTTASDIGGYMSALELIDATHGETSISTALTGTAWTAVQEFATEPGVPYIQYFPSGNLYCHTHVSTDAANSYAQFRMETYKRTAAGVETLIATATSVTVSGATPQEIVFMSTVTAPLAFDVDDRLVFKLLAARVNGPSTVTVTNYFEGTNRVGFALTPIIRDSAPVSIDYLTDVNTYGAVDGDVLTYDSYTGQWLALPPAAPSLAIDDLTDVNIYGLLDGDVLTWDSYLGAWTPQAPTGGTGSMALDDLTDVNIYGLLDGDVLTWDSYLGAWTPQASSGSGVTDHGALTGLADNDHPQYGLLDKGSAQTWQQYQIFDDGISVGYGYADIFNVGAAQVALWMYNESFAANQKFWSFTINADGSNMSWNMYGDSPSYTERKIISVARSGLDVVSITSGNSTDFPEHIWYVSNTTNSEFRFVADGSQRIELYGDASYAGLGVISEQKAGPASGYAYAEISTYGKTVAASDTSSSLWLGHLRGTLTPKVASQNGDESGDLIFYGHTSAGTPTSAVFARIIGTIETVNTTNIAGGLDIRTHSGTGHISTGQTSRMLFKASGEIALGTDSWFTFDEHTSAPGTPSAGRAAAYFKSDGNFYSKDDAGVEAAYAILGQNETVTGAWTFSDDIVVGSATSYVATEAVGTLYPALVMKVQGVDAYPFGEFTKYSDTGDTGDDYGGGFVFRQAMGTIASPTATQANTSVGELLYQARGTSSWLSGASIRYVTDTTATTTLTGHLSFLLHTGAGFTNETYARLKLYNTGEVALGTDGWLNFDEHASAPATPASGRVALYAKADGKLYIKDDTGTETDLTATGGGSGAGSAATATVTQAADLAVTSNTTYQDTDLVVALEAGKTYRVKVVAVCGVNATPDAKMQLDYTGTVNETSVSYLVQSDAASQTQWSDVATALPFFVSLGVTGEFTVAIDGIVKTTTAGNLKVQYAQQTSSATTVYFRQNSYLLVEEVPEGWAPAPTFMRGGSFVSSAALTTSAPPAVLYIDKAATITKVALLGDQSGSAEIDIKKVAVGSYTGDTAGSTICGTDYAAVSAAAQAVKTSFTGWTLSVAVGDVLIISLRSVSTFNRLTAQVFFEE